MRSRLIVPTAIIALWVVGCGNSTAGPAGGPLTGSRTRPTQIFRVKLAAAAPRGAAHGRGDAIIAFHGPAKLCWRFAHLHGFVSATRADIQTGTGAIAVPLSTGPRLHHQGCVAVTAALSTAIVGRPSAYYINLDSTLNPTGAVRGRL